MEHCQYKKLAEIILKRNRDNCYTFTEMGTLETILHNANTRQLTTEIQDILTLAKYLQVTYDPRFENNFENVIEAKNDFMNKVAA